MRSRCLFDTDVKNTFEPADIARWTGGAWSQPPRSAITGFSIDTRTLAPGDLFIAVRGETSDGHVHVGEAFARGASGVVVEDGVDASNAGIPALRVTGTRNALMDIAAGYRSTLAFRMTAVTGSVGKTTVKELLADMLQPVGVTARTRGNWNNNLGMPLSLLATPPDAQFGVFEVGMNHPGELDPLCRVLAPDIGIVTCVGPVHIEHFEDEAAIAREKAAVYRALQGRGTAIVNDDDRYAGLMHEAARGNRVVTVSARPGADYRYRRADAAHGRFELTEKQSGEVVELQTALPGDYFVLDAALSAAAARVMEVPWAVIRHAIQYYRPLALRWNRHTWFGVHTVNDAYNANPVSLRAAVQAFMEEPAEGSRWLVLAGMLELGAGEAAIHRSIGEHIARCHGLHLVTVGPRGAWIAEGAAAAGMPRERMHVMADHAAAAEWLDRVLAPGDAVLFKASRGESVEAVLEAWKKRRGAESGAGLA